VRHFKLTQVPCLELQLHYIRMKHSSLSGIFIGKNIVFRNWVLRNKKIKITIIPGKGDGIKYYIINYHFSRIAHTVLQCRHLYELHLKLPLVEYLKNYLCQLSEIQTRRQSGKISSGRVLVEFSWICFGSIPYPCCTY